MTPSEVREIEHIVEKAKSFTSRMLAGEIDIAALREDASAEAARHGLQIHPSRREDLNQSVVRFLDQNAISSTADLVANERLGDSGGCAACEVGLQIALAALMLLTVFAVAAAVVAFAPEVAAVAVVAFLDSSPAVTILFGVILMGAAALAALICTDLIKCKP